MYEQDLTWNNLQWLIGHKTQPINLIIYTQVYGCKWLCKYILPANEMLTGTTTLVQSETGSNDERVLHIPQTSKTRASVLDTILSNTQDIIFFKEVTLRVL